MEIMMDFISQVLQHLYDWAPIIFLGWLVAAIIGALLGWLAAVLEKYG